MFLSSGMDKNLKIWDANAQVPADVVLVNGKIYHHHMSPNATQHNLVAGYKFDPINANNAKILHIQLILPPLR
jgi:hypothetical protein